jgi:lipopolysaccharide export LptBFGC system permease protein LptF
MLQLCSTQEILQLIRQQKDNINNEAKQIVNFLEQKYPNTFMNTQNKTQLKRQMMNDIINNKITTNLQQYATAIKKEHYNKLNSIRSSIHKIKFYKNIILRRIVELLVCVLFLILGTAIGILLKRGSFIIHLIMAFFFISFYYVMTIIGENIIFTSYNTEQIGILLGIISLTPFILFFYYHASHDSQILNEGIGRLQNKLLVLMKNIFTSIKKSFQEVLKKRKH